MKHFSTLTFLALAACAQAATHELTNVETTFSPALLTIQSGDEIHLVLGTPHTCTQVNEVTWDANGTDPLIGGFDFPEGEHTFTLTVPGTYFFVCVPHADMGMKGRIVVEGGTGIREGSTSPLLQLMPNPANGSVRLSGTFAAGTRLELHDVNGRIVRQQTLSGTTTLDVSDLRPGNYAVILKDREQVMIVRERLVVAR